jgi:hypothetical protein
VSGLTIPSEILRSQYNKSIKGVLTWLNAFYGVVCKCSAACFSVFVFVSESHPLSRGDAHRMSLRKSQQSSLQGRAHTRRAAKACRPVADLWLHPLHNPLMLWLLLRLSLQRRPWSALAATQAMQLQPELLW